MIFLASTATIVVGIVIIAFLGFATYRVIRDKKNGSSCGCGGSCGGNCSCSHKEDMK